MSKTETPELAPVTISPGAQRALSERCRQWTGWRQGTLVLGETNPKVSRIATCDHANRTVTVDPRVLILNPNRVLLTVTPFRLRQEAILTGAILHEAGHARHTLWKPTTAEEMRANPMIHDDGTPVTKQEFALAKLMEEPRVEALMARDADDIGAVGLGWTMRTMAAHLLPTTELSMDPAQRVMDMISSWALRAGRQIGIAHHTRYVLPGWVNQFTSLLHMTIQAHLTEMDARGADSKGDPTLVSTTIRALLTQMIHNEDDHGTFMVDRARDVLSLLFPETDDEATNQANAQAMPSGECSSPEDAGDESDESNEGGSESTTAPESDDQDSDEGQDQEDDDSPGDDDSASTSSEEDSEDSEEDSEDSEDSEDGESEDASSDITETIAKTLAALEAESSAQVADAAEGEAEQVPPLENKAEGAGSGVGGALGGSWRDPLPDEREVQREAEHFLRDLIDASESSKRTLTDQPSSEVDGAALSAWKAGGQVRAPHFFVRTHRNIEPSPPIEIAILVDVSASMDELQKPSSLLSWSIAAAAFDLRNFAGRGQQVTSCLIHWGNSVRTIQAPGEVLPGIRLAACNQGTSNMHGAMDKVADLMPGFFDKPEHPTNRLLIQFTDWRLQGAHLAQSRIKVALENGVNMLSVVPNNYSYRWSSLSDILQHCPIQRGLTALMKYDPDKPGLVWRQAAQTLSTGAQSTGAYEPEPEGASMFDPTY